MMLDKSILIELQRTDDELELMLMLEAENTSEVFKGVAREMTSHLQALQFALDGSLQRESKLNLQLQEVKNIKNGCDLIEVNALKEKVRILEENLNISDSKLFEMENYIHLIRESVLIDEIRAEASEAKVSELTELNMELTNELEFVKCTNSDLEKELQNSKALSESSQEQQKELYMAIWDMETLIEDLKSKAFAAEMKLEKLEEQCLVLAETNSELNIQMSYVQSRAEKLEASLKEANQVKGSRVNDVNNGVKTVADLVLQLALERERIQKKVSSLEKENKTLMEERRRSKKSFFESNDGKKVDNFKEAYSFVNGFTSTIANGIVKKLQETSCTSNQVNDLVELATSNENEESASTSHENAIDESLGPENLSKQGKGNLSIRFMLMVILVPVVSTGAMLTALKHFLGGQLT